MPAETLTLHHLSTVELKQVRRCAALRSLAAPRAAAATPLRRATRLLRPAGSTPAAPQRAASAPPRGPGARICTPRCEP